MKNQDYQDRILKIREFITAHHMDSFLVTDPVNINYLSGFPGDEGVLLITDKTAYLISDERFKIELEGQKVTDFRITNQYLETVCEILEQQHLVAMGFEDTINYREYDYLDENSPADIVPTENVVEYFRSFKNEAEIKIIKRGAEIAGKAYLDVIKDICPGITEKQIADKLDFRMKQLGMEKASFDPIVASGAQNTVKPHHNSSSRKLISGDLLLIDFGYFYHGYTVDITRVCGIGKMPVEIHRQYSAVREALNETTKLIAPGLPIKELWQKANEILKKYDLDGYFIHGIGHGIGKSIHEMPSLSYLSDEKLQAGQVITIEPGVYIPEVGGIRLENDILVTENGFENLTDFGLDFIELDSYK